MRKGLFINGYWVEGGATSFSSVSPASGDVMWSGNGATPNQVEEAVRRARDAFSTWCLLSVDERMEVIYRFKAVLEENRGELAEAISLETGKVLWECEGEVNAMIGKIAVSLEAYHQRTGLHDFPDRRLTHKPLGVAAVFGPYNFPGHLPNGHIIPALIAGNTVVFKPSELTPYVAELSVRYWEQARLPNGVINLLQGGGEVGRCLVQSDIDGVYFTGSSATGIAIHKALAGRPDVLLALEMGGNNSMIIGDVSSVEVTARIILQSAFLSAGQRCSCTRRLILIRNTKNEEVIQRLVELISGVLVDHPLASPQPFIGSLISKKAVDDVLHSQDALVAMGAKVIRRAERLSLGEAFIKPGLIDMTGCDAVYDEEIFGPLLQMKWVDSFNDAIAEANNTQFGLAAGLISDDRSHQEQFPVRSRAGVIAINKATAGASSALPFGGVGSSGNYRPGAYYAADYCAWPQAQTFAGNTDTLSPAEIKGVP